MKDHHKTPREAIRGSVSPHMLLSAELLGLSIQQFPQSNMVDCFGHINW